MDFEPTEAELPRVFDIEPVSEPVIVVRLTKSRWGDKNGMHSKTSIRFLKRKCQGYNYMEDEASDIGYDEFVGAISNLETVPEGIYELKYDGVSRDWETGYYEADGYKLVPYKEEDHVAERKG